MIALGCSALWAGIMPAAEEMKTLDVMVDSLLAAYNAEDSKAFYTDYSSTMAALTTPEIFKMMIVDVQKKTFGNYVSRSILEAETVVTAEVPNALLVYTAKFEKNENAKLLINLVKENNVWKIQQVTIQPMP